MKFVIVPRVSSENRDYIPIGLISPKYIVNDSALAIFDQEIYVFELLTSKIQMVWIKADTGRLKTDYRYSKKLSTTIFPYPLFQKNKKSY